LIDIPNSVITIGEEAFVLCTNLTSIIIPNSVIAIERNTFNNCTKLTSVSIGNSVITIGYSAFVVCTNLISVSIGNSVTTIGEYAFYGCSSLASIIIPNSVTTIDTAAFAHCNSLLSVIIPNSVTKIEEAAFLGCSSLLSIDVDSNNIRYSSNDGILYNKLQDTLIQCPGGKKIVIVPESVKVIGFGAFAHCSKLTSVNIPNSVTTIGEAAFLGCSSLTSINIPDSVITIGDAAFHNCRDLTSISIGSSVSKIGNWAFEGCRSLDTIISKALYPPSIEQYTFYTVPKDAIVYIPCGSLWDYQVSWGFTNYIEDCDSVVNIKETVQNTGFKVYPNPAKNQLQITIEGEYHSPIQYSIYSVVGQVVMQAPLSPPEGGKLLPSFGGAGGGLIIDVSHLSAGMYFLKVDGKVVKFIKE